MKKKLLFILMFPIYVVSAQDYTPLQVSSGYNADVIADGINPAAVSTTIAVDNADYNFMSADYQATDTDTPPSYALPLSGLIESPDLAGLSYQLAPYYDNNSLRIENEGDYGAFTFSNPVMATKVYVMACSGSGQATMIGYIYFSDSTFQEITATVVPDWFFSTALPVVASGFGRVNRLTDAVENPSGNPRLYQIEIAILPENQAKTITGIDFTKTSTAEGTINIFAVSAEVLGSCPGPSGLETGSTATTGSVSWNPAVISPVNGYDYYFSTDPTTPAASQTPTGNVSSSTYSLNFGNLVTGQHYYVWVRSNCGTNDTGSWQPADFITGQLDTTYPDGDINTLFITAANINTESENTCPGLLYVDVPAGYKITSTAVSYDMQTASNGWKAEQRSILVCNTSGLKEDAISSGTGNTGGTQSYLREGLTIANDLTGSVEFELRAWRTYGNTDCDMVYNRVLGDTFKVTITYEALLNTDNLEREKFNIYPNPVHDVLTIDAKEAISEVRLYNMLGQQIGSKNGMNAQKVQLGTAELSNGTYIVKVQTASGTRSMNIIKN
ncbi:T9SS type A sorting domain-containing protein [Flavobacterium sp.]|uniref:T9SS type A sorting domain-containing protein n=1 Tax=Flavobacterium sp. TaxID=239 RepID=UPI00260FC9BA|nr:T9SS type A sorting domain-containing protein [Flavobacterium sp.]